MKLFPKLTGDHKNPVIMIEDTWPISCIGNIRKATKAEIRRAYKKINKELPQELQPKMKIVKQRKVI